MARLYHIACGVINYTVEETASLLAKTFDIDFRKSSGHPNCVVGVFFGTRICIQKNYNESTKTWAEIDENEFPVILYADNDSGREKDKLSSHKYLVQQLSQRDFITFLKEDILEQAD